MNKEFHYDIIVVGAGPAGSSAAYQASKNGVKVALLEKEESISETVRTSGVTWIQNIKEFKIPDNCYNPIKNYSFCSPSLLWIAHIFQVKPSNASGEKTVRVVTPG